MISLIHNMEAKTIADLQKITTKPNNEDLYLKKQTQSPGTKAFCFLLLLVVPTR